MNFNPTAYNLILLVGAIHGAITGGLLWTMAHPSKQANRLLAALQWMFCLTSLRILLLDHSFRTFVFFPVSFDFGFGPVLYLYTRSVCQTGYQFRGKQWWHAVPLALEVLYYIINYARPTAAKLGYVSFHYSYVDPAMEVVAIIGGLLYLFAAVRLVHRRESAQKPASGQTTFHWLRNLLIFAAVVEVGWMGFTGVAIVVFKYNVSSTFYIPLYLTISGIMYYIGFAGYRHAIRQQGLQAPPPLKPKNGSALHIDERDMAVYIARLKALMEQEHVYRESNLKVATLAQRMEVSPNLLSHILNTGIQQSFNDFVNSYRLGEVQRRLQDPSQTHLSIMGIAMEAGFRSEATFYRVFKKHTGMTPRQYQEKGKLE